MVNLREKPYYLNEEQIQWVEDTIAGMTTEEKIGQLFVNMVANAEERKPENIKKVLDTYHPGAIRYHNAPKEELWEMADCLQKTTKIPLLIASNCEAGGNGGCQGGTPIANGAAMAAIDSPEEVFKMAEISARELLLLAATGILPRLLIFSITGEIPLCSSAPLMTVRRMSSVMQKPFSKV